MRLAVNWHLIRVVRDKANMPPLNVTESVSSLNVMVSFDMSNLFTQQQTVRYNVMSLNRLNMPFIKTARVN